MNTLFNKLILKTSEYLLSNNIKVMILGISGGIDSTVCAAICHEVSKQTGIPLFGRSLPTHNNKKGETSTADLVGFAFCSNYREVKIDLAYRKLAYSITFPEGLISETAPFTFDGVSPKQTPLANGNIQARLRMIYLYNLASVYKGIVIDTDNLTEHNLGYWTLHGDVGDFNPIGGLWKTEVFELAEWIFNKYKNSDHNDLTKAEAVWASLQLKPTAGLGITNNDLEEIGAESYKQVDKVLKDILQWKDEVVNPTFENYMKDYRDSEVPFDDISIEVVENIAKRHFSSEFKRKRLPVKIERIDLQ